MKSENENLQDLINTIRDEAVTEADQQSQKILSDAGKKAEEMIAAAKRTVDDMRRHAEMEAQSFEKAGKEALTQAARDVIISLRNRITSILNTIVTERVGRVLSDKDLADIIRELIKKWDLSNSDIQLEVLLSEKAGNALHESILSELQTEFQNKVFLNLSPDVNVGFWIGEKDGNMQYDLTDEGLTEVLCAFLNPQFSEILGEGLSDASKD